MNMPQDPFMLLSLANTCLRDEYPDPEALCEGRDWDLEELNKRLEAAGFSYVKELNQYR